MVTPISEQNLYKTLEPNQILGALEHFRKRRTRRGYRTISMLAYDPTWRKVQNLIWAAKHRMNLLHAMMEHLREDPRAVRYDGAFDFVRTMLLVRAELMRAGKQPGKPLTILAGLLERHFPANAIRRRKSRKLYIPKDAARSRFRVRRGKSFKRVSWLRLQAVRAPRWERHVLSAAEYPIIGSLRTGAVRACALNLLTFYLQVTSYQQTHSRNLTRGDLASEVLSGSENSEVDNPAIDEPADHIDQEFEAITSENVYPTVAEIHAKWSADWKVYEEAARTPIPRTHNKGKPFGEALVQPRIRRGPKRGKRLRKPGKRLVRQLKEKMHSLEAIRKALRHVSVLLNRASYQHQPELVAEAEQAQHLWRRDERLQRTARASRFARYTYERSDDYVALDALNHQELQHYQNELLDDLDFAHQMDSIRTAMDIFLSPAPPSYPTVEPALFDDFGERSAFADALGFYHHPVPRNALQDPDIDNIRSSKLNVGQQLHRAEQDGTIKLLQSESNLGDPAQ